MPRDDSLVRASEIHGNHGFPGYVQRRLEDTVFGGRTRDRVAAFNLDPHATIDLVIWTSKQAAATAPAYPVLRIRIVQSASRLSGATRDEVHGVDVLVSSGSIDGGGGVNMTVVLSERGLPLQVLTFQGRVTGTGRDERIAGTYVGHNPGESGTFVMTHE